MIISLQTSKVSALKIYNKFNFMWLISVFVVYYKMDVLFGGLCVGYGNVWKSVTILLWTKCF